MLYYSLPHQEAQQSRHFQRVSKSGNLIGKDFFNLNFLKHSKVKKADIYLNCAKFGMKIPEVFFLW